MNALMFVKFKRPAKLAQFDGEESTIVLLVTVPRDVPDKQQQDAEIAGRLKLADWCRDDFKLDRVKCICETPDDVACFEPV